MQRIRQPQPRILLSSTCLGLLAAVSLSSCAPQMKKDATMSGGAPMSAPMDMAAKTAAAPEAAPPPTEATAQSEVSPNSAPATVPKLIKKAALTLLVEITDDTTKKALAIIKQQQGYAIDFQDNRSQVTSGQQTVSMQIRIPQERLDDTIAQLKQLGTVKSESLTAEDVSDQLVDVEARLRNLRKQEEMVLKIMDRSGSVGEVLNVARELSNIRDSIERIDAQLKNLKTQVAYSTIYLNIEAPVANAPSLERPVSLEFKETWKDATLSLKNVTVGILKLILWLLTFSPYIALIILGIYGVRRLKKRPDSVNTDFRNP
jgi:Domain of unknown function (DUF4349)